MVYNLKDDEKKNPCPACRSPPLYLPFPVSVSALLSIKGEKAPKNILKKKKKALSTCTLTIYYFEQF